MTQTFNSEDIKFPCRWHGSLLIFTGTPGYPDLIREVFSARGLSDCDVTNGNVSSSGKYLTWKMTAVVPDLQTLRDLFKALEALPGVRMLI